MRRGGGDRLEYGSDLQVMVRNARTLGDVWAKRQLRRPPRYLPIVLVFVTHRCNLRCEMCGVPEEAGAEQSAELSTAEWKSVIDSMARLGTVIVSFSGGETLLRRDMFELIRFARARNIAVHLCTNATNIDRGVALALRDAGPNTVSISLDSHSSEIHDSLRGDGAFVATLEGIRMLRTHAPNIRIGLNCLICTRNYRGMVEMLRLATEIGASQVKFAPIHTNLLHKDKPLEAYEQLMFRTREQVEDLEQEMARLVQALPSTPVQATSARYLRGIPNLYRKPQRFQCFAGYAVCAIGPHGEVSPCCDFRTGLNVRDMPLQEIWRSPAFHQLRAQVDDCKSACWDTTNTELSLRLSVSSLIADLGGTWKDLRFYFTRGRT